MRTLKHRDKVDLFLTLLAGLPLLASGLLGLSYVTTVMLSDYQHALWIAQAMSALLIWIGGLLLLLCLAQATTHLERL